MDIQCPKCENFLDPMFFAKDSTKPLGLDRVCKDCRRLYRQVNKAKELARWKRNYMPGSEQRKKHITRSQTRRKYGSAKEHICRCGRKAEEWHHIEYITNGAIPLCHVCHENI